MAQTPYPTTTHPDRREAVFRTISGSVLGCAYMTKRGPAAGYTDRLVDEYVGVYVLRGHGVSYDGEGRRQAVGPGDYIQHTPGLPHGVVPDDDQWIEFYFRFPETMYRALSELGVLDPRTVLRPGLDAELLNRFERLLSEMRQIPQREIGLPLARMHELLVTIQRLDHQPRMMDDTARWLDRACEALTHNPERRLDIPRLAQTMGLSYERFRKVFRLHMGVSPSEYRIRRRIDHARRLIAQDGLTVKQTAYRLGYPDPFSFSKQFTRYTGMSPTRFRETV